MGDLEALLERQAGVVARHQLAELGVPPTVVRRMLRRRELVVVHAGVYVDHTGPLTWLQRAWAAVLAVWPAALSHDSALRAGDGPGRRVDDLLHVAIERNRSPAAPAGVRLHRLAHLEERVHWNLGPPRVRIEEAVLDVAASSDDELSLIATLADAVQARRTTAPRLLDALAARPRVAQRSLLLRVLRDVSEGACSALEHGYLTRVERAHGLPRAERQLPISTPRTIFRDVDYAAYGLIVELDGRLFHDDARSRDRDLGRDLDAALSGRSTVRLGWGQVYGRPCETAEKVGRLLQAGGWSGAATPCPDCSVRYLGVTG